MATRRITIKDKKLANSKVIIGRRKGVWYVHCLECVLWKTSTEQVEAENVAYNHHNDCKGYQECPELLPKPQLLLVNPQLLVNP